MPGRKRVFSGSQLEPRYGYAGSSLAEVVRTRIFVTDAGVADAMGAAHTEAFGADPPATSMVVVAALLDERWLVEIEAEAVKTSS